MPESGFDWVSDALRDVPPILTLQEAADLLRMHPRTLRRAVARGQLVALRTQPAHALGSARLHFARASVATFLRKCAGA